MRLKLPARIRCSTAAPLNESVRPSRVPFIAAIALVVLAACGRSIALPAVWIEPLTGMEMVLLEPGTFDMGLRPDEPADARAAPLHRVTLTQPLYMGRFEVTQSEWRAVMGDSPAHFADCGERCPVEDVSWQDVAEFVRRLNEARPGDRVRLPTEAEWEYACRAGSHRMYAVGDTLRAEDANFDGSIPFEGGTHARSPGRPLPAGSYPANAWGLHDLHGNVWEWTSDEYCPLAPAAAIDPRGACASDTMVIRGGSWFFSANAARCGRRYVHARGDSGFSLGFRLVRDVD